MRARSPPGRRPRREHRGRVAAVERDGDEAGRVLVHQRLAPPDVGKGPRVARHHAGARVGPAARETGRTRASSPGDRPAAARSAAPAWRATLPKGVDAGDRGHDRLADLARGSSSRDQPGRVERVARLGERPARGEARRDRREQVPAVEGGRDRLQPPRRPRDPRPPPRRRRSARPPASAARCRARPGTGLRRRCGARPRAAAPPTPGSTTATCTPAARRQRPLQHQRAVDDVLRRIPWPRSITRAVRRDPRDHRVAARPRTRPPSRSR